MRWRPWRWCVLALAMGLLGCSSDNDPQPLTGTWTGTLQDSLAGRGALVLNISQVNRQLTGTWQSTFPDGRNNNGGTLSGTGPAQDLMITMVWSSAQPGACSFTVTAMLDNNDEDHFTGTYVPLNCAQPESGSLDVTRH
jgi:hypothetical protein